MKKLLEIATDREDNNVVEYIVLASKTSKNIISFLQSEKTFKEYEYAKEPYHKILTKVDGFGFLDLESSYSNYEDLYENEELDSGYMLAINYFNSKFFTKEELTLFLHKLLIFKDEHPDDMFDSSYNLTINEKVMEILKEEDVVLK